MKNLTKNEKQTGWDKLIEELAAWIPADETTPEMVDMLNWDPLGKEEEIKCECGSEKVGSSFHSKWCPKDKK